MVATTWSQVAQRSAYRSVVVGGPDKVPLVPVVAGSGGEPVESSPEMLAAEDRLLHDQRSGTAGSAVVMRPVCRPTAEGQQRAYSSSWWVWLMLRAAGATGRCGSCAGRGARRRAGTPWVSFSVSSGLGLGISAPHGRCCRISPARRVQCFHHPMPLPTWPQAACGYGWPASSSQESSAGTSLAPYGRNASHCRSASSSCTLAKQWPCSRGTSASQSPSASRAVAQIAR
jgi:hypothetical protein